MLKRAGIALTAVLITTWMVIQAVTPLAPKPTDPLQLYSNQARNDLRIAITRAIMRAQQSVAITAYTLNEPSIIAALNRIAKKGRQVTVSIEAPHAKRAAKQLHDSIKVIPIKMSGLQHRKIAIIDSAYVWIGSANFTFDSLRGHGNLVAAFYSPQIATSLSSTGSLQTFDVNGQSVELWKLPDDRAGLTRVIEAINAAQTSLRIAMFTWTHPDITDAVIAASGRGVHVEAIIDGNQGRGVGKKVVVQLAEAGIHVRLSSIPELLHHKFAWIDETTLLFGSTNWTRAAFTKNGDCFLVLSNLNAKQHKQLRKVWKVSWLESQRVLSN